MEVLGVAASIVGLVAAAGKVIGVVAPVLSSLQDAARIAAPVHAEVVNCRIILYALQGLVNTLSSTPQMESRRAALIQVDHLLSVLLDGVLLFSDLETLVLSFGSCHLDQPVPFQVRVRWVQNENAVNALLVRLQGFKSSTSLILNIFQCNSDIKAAESQESLASSVSTLLETNEDLAQRLGRLESCLDTMSIIGKRPPREDPAEMATIHESVLAPRFEFEADLELSRPYRNVRARGDKDSFHMDRYSRPSSFARSTAAWSIFSDLSLSEISTISALALPLVSTDLGNPQHYEFSHNEQANSLPPVELEKISSGRVSEAVAGLTDALNTLTQHLEWQGPASQTDFPALNMTPKVILRAFDVYIPASPITLSTRSSKSIAKLQALNGLQFGELSVDVIDELSRRAMIFGGCESVPPFLTPQDIFHPKRNQARQKLRILADSRFSDLVTDVYRETERRALKRGPTVEAVPRGRVVGEAPRYLEV